MNLDPKAVAHVLTAEGFIRWAEGKKLRHRDFKRLPEIVRSIAAAKS